MKIQFQGHNECLLATIAILRGIPLSTIRVRAHKVLNTFTTPSSTVSWAEFVQGPTEVPKYLHRNIIHKLLTDFKCTKYVNAETFTLAQCPVFLTGINDSELKGKGSISFAFYIGDVCTARHICAYEKGLIYDSLELKPLTLSQWLAQYPRARIEEIIDGKL